MCETSVKVEFLTVDKKSSTCLGIWLSSRPSAEEGGSAGEHGGRRRSAAQFLTQQGQGGGQRRRHGHGRNGIVVQHFEERVAVHQAAVGAQDAQGLLLVLLS